MRNFGAEATSFGVRLLWNPVEGSRGSKPHFAHARHPETPQIGAAGARLHPHNVLCVIVICIIITRREREREKNLNGAILGYLRTALLEPDSVMGEGPHAPNHLASRSRPKAGTDWTVGLRSLGWGSGARFGPNSDSPISPCPWSASRRLSESRRWSQAPTARCGAKPLRNDNNPQPT